MAALAQPAAGTTRLLVVLLCACAATLHAAEPLREALDTRVAAQEAAVRSQARIDELSEESRELLEEYRSVLTEGQRLRAYNDQIEQIVRRQEAELVTLESQLESARDIQRLIVPLMRRMLDVLDEVVRRDLPFLPGERNMRLASLRDLIDRPDVSLADKYGRLLEAYQVELDYGRTIEAYTGTLSSGQSEGRTVEFLRIGRIALLYQTFDGLETGLWHRGHDAWMVLPAAHARPVARALRVARREAPPEMLRIPVPAPVASE